MTDLRRYEDEWEHTEEPASALHIGPCPECAKLRAILNDWVKSGNHTQEWQFYIGQLFNALASSHESSPG